MKLVKFFILLVLPLAIISCNKDVPLTQKKDAVIKYTGEYAVDGCGYFLVVDGKDYKPTNEQEFDDSYRIEGETEVIAEYVILDEPPKRFCFGPGEYQQVNIVSLTKK